FIVEERAAEGPLGALAAGDPELLGRELTGPLGVGLDDLGNLDGAHQLALAVEDLNLHGRLPGRARAQPRLCHPVLIRPFYAGGFLVEDRYRLRRGGAGRWPSPASTPGDRSPGTIPRTLPRPRPAHRRLPPRAPNARPRTGVGTASTEPPA